MDKKELEYVTLELMQQGAFRVENNIITYLNTAAQAYPLMVGTAIDELLISGAEEYRDFAGGCLCVTLNLYAYMDAIEPIGATVIRTQQGDLFVMDDKAVRPQFQALAQAAIDLRDSLSGAIISADRLRAGLDAGAQPELQLYSAQLNRRLMQMQRIISNMSDCTPNLDLARRSMELVDVCAVLDEILSNCKQRLTYCQIHLEYALPQQQIFSLIHVTMLERALYNLISNAVKYAPAGSTLRVQLTRHGSRLVLSVTDQGCGIADKTDIFTRYLRTPRLEDSRNGIGLGMVLVRAAATLHGGAVLIDQPESGGTRVSISMRIQQPREHTVCSPALRIDYAGERDHCLLELSDVLPAELYK